MLIRKAHIEDIPFIGQMAQVAFRHTYADILSPAQMDYMMDMMYSRESLVRQITAEGNTFFVDDEGRGYVSFRPDGYTPEGFLRYHLEKLYVLPQFQKTGLGRQLFYLVVEEVRRSARSRQGHLPVRLELNVNRNNPAVGFYEHLGMRKDRQGDFPIGGGFYMNDYIMALDIL